MKYGSITEKIEKLACIESVYEEIILKYTQNEGKKIISSPCFFLPPEIMASFDIIPLKIPEFLINKTGLTGITMSLYSHVIISEKKCFCNEKFNTDNTVYIFRTPNGYGEDSAVFLHNEISLILKTLFDIDLKSINIEKLQKETLKYEQLRRMIRSISALRSENPDLLSNSGLSLIFETALTLPPEIAMEYISPVFVEMKKYSDKNTGPVIHAMLYGGKTIPSVIADNIEKSGINIVEDDSCFGRRLFDLSINAESEYIFYELLDAYSYRVLTPCLRPAAERYELLYKLLKNYNIETVIFFTDNDCKDSMKDIEYLRVRMMRDGIDPVVIDNGNYLEKISDYADRIKAE